MGYQHDEEEELQGFTPKSRRSRGVGRLWAWEARRMRYKFKRLVPIVVFLGTFRVTIMHGLLLAAGLLSLPLRALGHPNPNPQMHTLSRRGAVDLDAFRLGQNAEYSNTASVASNPPALSIRSTQSYVDVTKDLVKTTLPDATFRVVDDHYVGTNGVAHVHLRQTVHGIDVDNADFNVNVSPSEILLQGRSQRDPCQRDHATGINKKSSAPSSSRQRLRRNLAAISGKKPRTRRRCFSRETSEPFPTPRVNSSYFISQMESYSLILEKMSNNTHGVVDPWGINDPTDGEREVLTDPWDGNASEFTWISDGRTRYPTTRGNNGIAQDNPSGGNQYENNYRPMSDDLRFEYPYSTDMSPPDSYIDASITQLFYTSNVYHDLLYILGFTERAGNFEFNNNNQGGRGNDYVILNSQDGSGTNNANFATPPDGQPGRMRMYTWTTSRPNRDGSFEAGIVIHEYTHGLSNRLCGGPSNSRCLNALESGGMGEGWGDFMATAIRLKAGDTRETDYTMGEWAANEQGGIRQHPYSTNLQTNPLVYTTVNQYREVHDIGTVWASMLYEVLWNLIDKHGKNDGPKPELRDGVPTDGKYLAMKLVIDGMALQPCNPNFVQARDAILDADEALTGGENKCEIWAGFAKRELGTGARYDRSRRTGSTDVPQECQ
ncbi:extracellular elastinolytic metalloproteinase [Coccidioides immitis RMSCC 3703]|uniref:Extracellular metalloproteinase n=1 Tax=Coccidioides immitis RMSCC 3703 TaxID=454286 RepID=A0A0J8QXZ5_COCIT|nr:extracellular elastinolytic metalloproteinase [Coccidioides immitis RMSCC 3703]